MNRDEIHSLNTPKLEEMKLSEVSVLDLEDLSLMSRTIINLHTKRIDQALCGNNVRNVENCDNQDNSGKAYILKCPR